MPRSRSIHLIRLGFVLLTTVVGLSLAAGEYWWVGALGGMAFGAAIVALDAVMRDITFRGFASGTFGLLIGLFCARLVVGVGFFDAGWFQQSETARSVVQLCLYLGLGFVGMMLALRSRREEFSLIIPYVRFRQEALQESPLVLDASVIADGRVPRLCAAGFLSGPLQVPRFVLDELHHMAESREERRSQIGKRGLECLNQLQKNDRLGLSILEDVPGGDATEEARLVALARSSGGRLLTMDANLARVARVQNVTALCLNELAHAMRPVVVPGDEIELNLVKEGKDEHQAVGYLHDGTMIVVNQAEGKIGTSQMVVVAGAVQTSAGRLIFAELKETVRLSRAGSKKAEE
ncbi:MAG: hypothetical protein R3F31_03315 [Verrucomicrobiales bacterium]